ncbi:MAG: SGNH/GDSL hydrolase family protein, partial [Rhodococcus sp. (in: high G+C Gram-positive bacteria)]
TARTLSAGGHPVALADLLSPEFLAAPDTMFSADRFHPSAAGYELAAKQILPVLASALGVWHGGPLPELPTVSAAAESRKTIPRATAALDRFLRRRTAELDAEISTASVDLARRAGGGSAGL